MYARIGTFDVSPENLDELTTLFHAQVVPAFSEHSGFIGYQAFVDRERGRFVGISLWRTRSELEGSVATAQRALNSASNIGAVTVGEPQILEMAFDARAQQ